MTCKKNINHQRYLYGFDLELERDFTESFTEMGKTVEVHVVGKKSFYNAGQINDVEMPLDIKV